MQNWFKTGGEWPRIPRPAQEDGVAAALGIPGRLQLIVGPAGIGKSTLAETVASGLPDRMVIPVIALTELSGVPMGAFAPAVARLGLDAASDRLPIELVTAIGRHANGVVVVVDDIPRLDDVSAALVYELVRGFGAPTIATARSGEALPSPIRRAADEGLCLRWDLDGLASEDVARLLERRFGARPRYADLHRLMERSAGNPLHLRMLVERAERRGGVTPDGESVRVDEGADAVGLDTAMAQRIAELTPGQHDLLHVAVLLQPVTVLELGGGPDLLTLVARGLLADDGTGRLRATHPLIAEAFEHAPGRRDAADTAVRLLRRRTEPADRMRALTLQLDASDRTVDDAELLWGIEYAISTGDFRLAIHAVDTVLGQGPHRELAFVATLRAAEACSLMSDLDRAGADFAAAQALAETSDNLAQLVIQRGQHLAYRRYDIDAAVAQAEQMLPRLDEAGRAAVAEYVANWRSSRGEPASSTLRTVAERVAPEIALRAAIMAGFMRALRCDKDGAQRASESLRRLQAELGRTDPIAQTVLDFVDYSALIGDAHTDDAIDLIESKRAGVGDMVGVYTCLLAITRLYRGQIVEASRLAALAVDQLRWRDRMGWLGLALGYQAVIAARRRDIATARRILDEMTLGQRHAPLVPIPRAEAQAWIDLADGQVDQAVARLLRMADREARVAPVVASLALAGVIRAGEAAHAVGILDRVLSVTPVKVVQVVRDLAVALRDHAYPDLPTLVTRAAHAGLEPITLDAIALALQQGAKGEIARKLEAIVTRTDPLVDEELIQRRPPSLITPRELEVARLASTRMRSREIAARLGISVRTVDNQLASVYRKLGVSSRDELADALDALGLR
ncbi:LuxR C-terminal-related transcriptional regulator [Hamadaea sp. NPDC051192]|uniref:LuxR C-terminal-related transcriptional regulator n=1 Tax=Hamadaea sp. NPDC051192 TaxID=3154940 RepID=UPI003428F9BA